MGERDFVVIDFETANPNRASACAVGMAKVRDGQVIATYQSLIRPLVRPGWFTFTDVHGISASMVKDAPSWDEVWGEILPFTEGLPLVAHNAPFDYSVIHKSLMESRGRVDHIANDFYCSVRLAKHLAPNLEKHGLAHLASVYGVELNHHDALSDATATARIAALLLGHHGTTFEAAAQRLPTILYSRGLTRTPGGKPAPGKTWSPSGPMLKPPETLLDSPTVLPQTGAVVFTGEPPEGENKIAYEEAVLAAGLSVGSKVNAGVVLLVTGPWYADSLRGKATSLKFLEAVGLRAAGQPLEIISYETLATLLP